MALRQIGLLRPKTILEVGAADCRLANLITQRFPDVDIVALDLQFILLNYNREGISNRVVADTQYLPFKSNSFDCILSVSCVKHVKCVDKAISEWHRVLKDKGHLIIIEPSYFTIRLGKKLKYFNPSGAPNSWSVKETVARLENSGFKYVSGDYFDLIAQNFEFANLLYKILSFIRFCRFTLYQYVVMANTDTP